jgi:Transcriptional regulator PadR-like family
MQQQHYAQAKLSRPDSLILASFAHGPRQVIALQEALEQAEGLPIEPGTLYRVLAHLEQRGWIEGLPAEGPLRRYRLTALGHLAFQHAGTGDHSEDQRDGGSPGLLPGKENIMRLVIWMLCLYPPTWRERYEAEMVALLEQHAVTFWTVLDLFIGALDARLDPHYRQSRQLLPMRRLQTSWRLFASACVACWFGLAIWF